MLRTSGVVDSYTAGFDYVVCELVFLKVFRKGDSKKNVVFFQSTGANSKFMFTLVNTAEVTCFLTLDTE